MTIKDPFQAATNDPDLSLEQKVDAFRAIARTNAQQKRQAGRMLYAWLRKSGDKPLLRRFLLGFNACDTDYEYIRFTGDRARHTASFRVAMAQRTRRMKKLGRHTCPEWILWDKPEGIRFARKIGLRHAIQSEVSDHRALGFAPHTVIKPENESQSQGVYLIFSQQKIGDVARNTFFSGYDELAARIAGDLASGRVRQDRWVTENLLWNRNEPACIAPDWKFYMFYGEVGMIGKMNRFPDMAEVWFDERGGKKDLGYVQDSFTLDVPDMNPDLLETARAASLEIPAPFIRVDLLETDEGPAFCEFTARPHYWYKFGRKLDLEFGDAFIAAEARLQADLLAGKDFAAWKSHAAHRADNASPPC